MDGLELTLAAAAFLAGLTGTWSPCGFSMIETIGPVGHTGGRSTTLAACLTFTLGALGRRRRDVRRPWRARRGGPRRRRPARLRARRGARPGRRARRAARHRDHAPGPPPASRALAAGDADAGRRWPLRRPAGPRLHHVRPHIRCLRARRNRGGGRGAGGWRCGRARVRRRTGPADHAGRADRRPAGGHPGHGGDGGPPGDLPGFPRWGRARPPGRRRGARRHRPRDGVEGRGAVRRRSRRPPATRWPSSAPTGRPSCAATATGRRSRGTIRLPAREGSPWS